MKIPMLVHVVLIGLLLGVRAVAGETPPAEKRPVRYVIGLSPFLNANVKDAVYRSIIRFVLEDMPVSSSVWLYDAYHLRTITQISIPDVRAFRSSKTRSNQFKPQIHQLREFLAEDHARPENSKLNFDDAIRFPQFLDFVGENLLTSRHSAVAVILGSPLYVDPKEPGFSMVDGYFPSDGHLLASREASVFGLKSRTDELKDLVVHFGYFGDPWVSEIHQEKISRFWTLYLKGQGARLATFCGDLPTIFNSLRSGSEDLAARDQRLEIKPHDSKIEMLRITRDIGVADWITRDALPNVATGPPSKTKGPMKIGIRWQGNIDLDLYATPHSQAETLFFEHTRSPEGYYFKDHRSSPEREYEFIEFESVVDVWQVRAMVNFYKGAMPAGPSGEIRIEFDGKIFSGRFSISSGHGNEGRSGAGQSTFWVRVDIPELLKLRQLR